MANSVNLVLVLSALDRASAVIDPALRKLDARMAGLGKNAGAIGDKAFNVGRQAGQIGLAAAASLAVPLKAALEYEQVLADIGQKADLTTKQQNELGASILRLAPALKRSASELAGGVDILAGFGLAPNVGVDMLAPISMAANAYRADIADLANTSFAVYSNLKVPINQVGDALAAQATAGKMGAFELKEMAQYFPALTASYQALGQKGVPAVGDLAAALQITRKGAGDGAEAANNLANVLQKINSPATRRRFAALGVDLDATMKKLQAAGATPIEAIAMATDQALKGNLARIGDIFEDAQVQRGLRPIIQNLEEYRRIRLAAQSAGGATLGRDAAARGQSTPDQLRAATANAKTALIGLGTAMMPMLRDILNAVTPVIQAVSAWIMANPELAGTLGKLVASLAAISLAISGVSFVFGGLAKGLQGAMVAGRFLLPVFGRLASFFVGTFGRALMFVGRAIMSLTTIMMANPILLIITAIAVAAFLIYKYWGPIKAWFIKLWTDISNFVTPLIQKFKTFGSQIINGLVEGIKAVAMAPINAVTKIASGVSMAFKGALGIKSPSRVFMEYGRYVSLGAAAGITSAAPMAAQATQNMATGITTAAPAARGGSGGGITVVYSPTVNINGGAPGAKNEFLSMLAQHKQEIARMVEDQQKLNTRKKF